MAFEMNTGDSHVISVGLRCLLNGETTSEAIDRMMSRKPIRCVDCGNHHEEWAERSRCENCKDNFLAKALLENKQAPLEVEAVLNDRPCYLYVMSNPFDLLKIGISTNTSKRIKDISNNSGLPVKLEWSLLVTLSQIKSAVGEK